MGFTKNFQEVEDEAPRSAPQLDLGAWSCLVSVLPSRDPGCNRHKWSFRSLGWDSLLKQGYSEKVTIASWVGGGSNVWYIEKWIARNGRKWYRIIWHIKWYGMNWYKYNLVIESTWKNIIYNIFHYVSLCFTMFHFMKNNPICELKRYFWVTTKFVQRSAAADVDAAELGFAQFRKSSPLQQSKDTKKKILLFWILPKKTSIYT